MQDALIASKSSLINMVALLLAFLVIWSAVLFCGVVIVAMVAVVNRLNQSSQSVLAETEKDELSTKTESDSESEDSSARATDQETDEEMLSSTRNSST